MIQHTCCRQTQDFQLRVPALVAWMLPRVRCPVTMHLKFEAADATEEALANQPILIKVRGAHISHIHQLLGHDDARPHINETGDERVPQYNVPACAAARPYGLLAAHAPCATHGRVRAN